MCKLSATKLDLCSGVGAFGKDFQCPLTFSLGTLSWTQVCAFRAVLILYGSTRCSKRPRFQVHVDMWFLSWSKQRSENGYTLFIKGWTWLVTIFRCLNDALLILRGPRGANKSPPHTYHYTTTPVVYTKFWSYNLNVATQIKTHQIKQCPVSPPKLRP